MSLPMSLISAPLTDADKLSLPPRWGIVRSQGRAVG